MFLKNFTIVVILNIIMIFTNQAQNTSNIQKKTVMITQIIEHPALTAVRMGAIQALKDYGFDPATSLELIYENAQGNITTAAQIAQKFVGYKPDLIIAISTPSAQTIVTAARGQFPVVFAAVTDPLAAKLVKSLDKPGNGVTGVVDRAPFEQQMLLIKQLMGDKNRLGFVYNTGEVNSVVALDIFRNQAQALGINILEVNASKSSEVGIAVQSVIDKIDAIYIPNDNTIVSSLDSILKICNDVKKPVFAADVMLVEHGVLATLGVDYSRIGYMTGELAVKILQGTPAGDISVISPHENIMYVNTTQAQKIGINIPIDIIDKADKVF